MNDSQRRGRPARSSSGSHRSVNSRGNGSASRRSSDATPHPNARKRRRKPKRRWPRVLLVIAVLFVFAIGGIGLGAVTGILQSTEMLNVSDVMPEAYTSIIYDDAGNEVDKLHKGENREYVTLDEIPVMMQHAAVAIEDERFYEHGGIDIRGIFRAMIENVKTMSFLQGASTITQQLIKTEVLSAEKSISRKVKEQYLAVKLENMLEDQLGSKEAAKNYILELYLNTIALGHGLNGVEAAAQYYFGKHVGELTLAECACIVSITNNPSLYSPDSQPENNRKRMTLVLDNMKEQGYISEAEYDSALAEDVYSKLVCTEQQEEGGTANHNYFVEAMINQLAVDLQEDLGYTEKQAYNLIYSGGLEIYSTMNTDMQEIVDDVFTDDSNFPAGDGTLDVTYLISVLDTTNPDEDTNQSHYERKTTVTSEDEVDAFVESVKEELLDETHELVLDNLTVSRSLQAAMVIMDQQNGQIKALVGGRGQKPGDSVFNRATQAYRQQGSAMKPLASYAPAIDTGLLMPGSIIIDEPVTYGSWSPKNWNGKYLGPTTVRDGIKNSMNVLAVKTFMMVGAETSFEYMQNMGIKNLVEEDKAATTALGGLTKGVTVLEMTNAYATIANGGIHYEPIYYTKVLSHDGEVLIDNTDNPGERVLKATTAYLLTDMMKDVITGGTGTAAAISGMTVAGKTGTTNDTKDLTFYGYTPYYTAGIWMGYDSAKVMNVSGSAHTTIWKNVMTQIHEGLANKDFERPDGIVTQTVCAVTGDIPSDLCSSDYYGYSTRSDIAAADFEGASSVCTAHQTFNVCRESGKLASANCPAEDVMQVVLAVDGTKILSKPGTIPEGKMDIDISQECTMDHSQTNVSTDPTDPSDPNGNTGTGDLGEEDVEIPPFEDDQIENPNFGIQ